MALLLSVFVSQLAGCAALHPIKGVPARHVPSPYLAEPRSGKKTIDLSLLRQTPAEQHYVDSGDVLAIYIEGVLGRREDVPPVHFPENGETRPSLGYPIPVRGDGTISVPLAPPVNVRGLTIPQVETALRRAYTIERRVLEPGRDRIFVALQRPREYRVLVIRQEEGNLAFGGQGVNPGSLKRGTGQVVRLPVYRNDVLNALAETNGLPGLDAENAIYVIRSRKGRGSHGPALAPGPGLPGGPGRLPAGGVHPQFPQPVGQPVSQIQPPAHSGIQLMAAEVVDQSEGAAGMSAGQTVPAVEWNHSSDSMRVTQVMDHAAGGWGHSPVPTILQSGAAQQFPHPGAAGEVPFPGVPTHDSGPARLGLPEPGQPPAGLPAGGQWNGQYGMAGEMPAGNPHGVTVVPAWRGGQPGEIFSANEPTVEGSHIIRIPVRLAPGEVPQFSEQDIILQDGDIVFIESRDAEVFYTGGLLSSGQFTLPRDYDLDILGAIAIAEGQQQGGNGKSTSGSSSALNQDVTISASQAIIIRRLPDGRQFPIHVDLYRAVRRPEERILVQPGDYILLQYTRIEAFAAFIERHLLEGALFSLAASRFNSSD